MIPKQFAQRIYDFRRALYLKDNNNIGKEKNGPRGKKKLEERSLSNEKDVIQAFFDIYYHPNTLWSRAGGAGKHKLSGKQNFEAKKLLTDLGERIFVYIRAGKKARNWDAFALKHEKWCNFFLNGINAIRSNQSLGPKLPDMSYGQAQKLINLAFKYLVCYKDYEKYASKFEFCHLVIDNQVMKELDKPERLVQLFDKAKIANIPCIKKGKVNGHTWTKFDPDDYKKLVEGYRKAFDPILRQHKYFDVTYLEIEFNLWPALPEIR